MFVIISLLLIGFATAIDLYSITTGAIRNNTLSASSNQAELTNGEDSSDNETSLEESENTASVTATNTNRNTDTKTARERIKAAIAARNKEKFFCGKSTFGECQTDADCITAGCSNSVCQGVNEEPTITTCEWKECYDSTQYKINCICIKNKCLWSRLTETQIKKIIKKENRINATARVWECPTECTCAGSTIKCQLASGREMTIIAGNSGNVIVQVKGENMSTNVILYKSNGKLYGVFRNNETKVVRMLPDQVKERIKERIKARLHNENITLNEDGEYEYQAEKTARLFFVFPVRMVVRAEIDAETGEVIKVSKPKWWAFLARDEKETVLGESCGTVTSGENDNCCKNKGYDVWNAEKNECDFSE